MKMSGRVPHVVAIPFPAQGHVIPLMELSLWFADQGIKVTFVNTEFNHARVIRALADMDRDAGPIGDKIRLVSIPDGLGPEEDRNDLGKLSEAMFTVMPDKLEQLIGEINGVEDDKVTCIVSDISLIWPLEVSGKMKIPLIGFWPASLALLVLGLSIPKLIDDGVVNQDGVPVNHQMIQLASNMPVMSTSTFVWSCIGDAKTQMIIFDKMMRCGSAAKIASRVICNSSYELEQGAFDFAPWIQPIGPLLASNRLGSTVGHFWAEDSSCLEWLDQQSPRSVIYIAFGSFTVFDRTQFQELALGLELSDRPFLWVVRPDSTIQTDDLYPLGFHARVSKRGKMVRWAPQQRVLAHPSVACFLSHCGWNSIMEGVSNGLPFLCWPYFADQFLDETYVSDVWKTGLRLDRDEKGIVTRGEIQSKINRLLGEDEFGNRARDLMKVVKSDAKEGGRSYKNFSSIIEWVRAL